MNQPNVCPWETDTYENTCLALMHAAQIVRAGADYHAACCALDADYLRDAAIMIEDVAQTMRPAHQPKPRPDEGEIMTIVTATMGDGVTVLTWDPDRPDRLGLWSVGQFGLYVVPIETLPPPLRAAIQATATDGQPREVAGYVIERSES